jgi:hypothetical protein
VLLLLTAASAFAVIATSANLPAIPSRRSLGPIDGGQAAQHFAPGSAEKKDFDDAYQRWLVTEQKAELLRKATYDESRQLKGWAFVASIADLIVASVITATAAFFGIQRPTTEPPAPAQSQQTGATSMEPPPPTAGTSSPGGGPAPRRVVILLAVFGALAALLGAAEVKLTALSQDKYTAANDLNTDLEVSYERAADAVARVNTVGVKQATLKLGASIDKSGAR